jgi:hypothetical protein
MKSIIQKDSFQSSELNQRINSALAERLSGNDAYNKEEITKVSNLKSKLMPEGFVLSTEQTENLRALCKLSKVELKPAREITSHRKIIGPVIVFLKKLTWPLMQIHLKDTFNELSDFCSWTVKTIAKQTIEIEELKDSTKQNKN